MTADAIRNMLLTARMQAHLARALYDGRDGVAALADFHKANFRYLEVGNNACAALIFPDHVHLSICGSNDLLDWAQNASTAEARHSLFGVHKGYLDASESLKREIIRSSLLAIINTRNGLVIGGHSAGGAIAQVMATDERFKPREVCTFGSPKAFTDVSAAIYHAYDWETFRFVMSGDPVPYMPLSTVGYLTGRKQFAHTTSALYLSDNGVLTARNVGLFRRVFRTIGQAYAYGVAVLTCFRSAAPRISQNHSIHRYCAAIDRAVENV